MVVKDNLIMESSASELLDMINASVYYKDLDGKYLFCNKYMLDMFGFKSRDDVIGKIDTELLSAKDATKIKNIDKSVLKNGSYNGEEQVIINGQKRTYYTNKTQLFDSSGKVIGIFGTSIDITDAKKMMELEKQQAIIDEEFRIKQIINVVHSAIFWKDLDGRYLGCNSFALNMLDLKVESDVVGKTDDELGLSKKLVDHFRNTDKEAIKNGFYRKEEVLTGKDNKKRTYLASKVPLHDSNNAILGVVGTTIEITAQKEAEQLRLENEANKTSLKEQDKFKTFVDQVSHDVRSPLSSLQMVLAGCDVLLPEKQRLAIRNAVSRIEDIMGNLLSKYDSRNNPAKSQAITNETPQVILVSTALLQILTEKRYQYQGQPIEFEYDSSKGSSFACINVQPNSFKRMVSNLMNNAIAALENQPGKIKLILDTNISKKRVKIAIQDTGKGMSEVFINKLLTDTPVIDKKSPRRGIGLTQVRETLQQNNGTMDIDSKIGGGTAVFVYFDKVNTPKQIATQIVLNENDIVIVLDDDESIHGAWSTHFEQVMAKFPLIQLNHFSSGQETIDCINNLDEKFKDRVFLLSDYELIDQQVNGLDVIMQTKVKRKILVTSHYANQVVLKNAADLDVQILPKQLALETPIKVVKTKKNSDKITEEEIVTIHTAGIVILDDDEMFVDSVIDYAFLGIDVDKYHDPAVLLQNIHKYPKNTRLILDYHYYEIEDCEIDGLMIAKQLHEMGYTDLYVLSGQVPNHTLPDYVHLILKNDLDQIKTLASK